MNEAVREEAIYPQHNLDSPKSCVLCSLRREGGGADKSKYDIIPNGERDGCRKEPIQCLKQAIFLLKRYIISKSALCVQSLEPTRYYASFSRCFGGVGQIGS